MHPASVDVWPATWDQTRRCLRVGLIVQAVESLMVAPALARAAPQLPSAILCRAILPALLASVAAQKDSRPLILSYPVLDGTRVKANSSRYTTASAKTLAERLAVLDEQMEKMLAQADQVDGEERDLFGDSVSPTTLPANLANLERRQERLHQALKAAQKADARRQGSSKRPARVPVADPESAILPNKEGGYHPNFNPIAAVDGECGMIVDADVVNHIGEAETVLPVAERIESNFGRKPAQMLADSAFATGANLSKLEADGVEALMPVEQTQLPDGNPAARADPREPVAEEDWPRLPRRARTQKLDRAAFVYDVERDCYWCPMGRKLSFADVRTKSRETGEASIYQVYRSESCAGCRLAGECLAGKGNRRTVMHDQHEAARRKVAARLKTESGRAAYARRAHLAETPNAVIKEVMGLRRFLLRGLEKVRTEWLWACTAFNIRKLIRLTEILGAEGVNKPA
ncbi:MAG TPA: transposase [Phycisphaerae bacterium]|nr:transposase [Phycisphaerae bacterium]